MGYLQGTGVGVENYSKTDPRLKRILPTRIAYSVFFQKTEIRL